MRAGWGSLDWIELPLIGWIGAGIVRTIRPGIIGVWFWISVSLFALVLVTGCAPPDTDIPPTLQQIREERSKQERLKRDAERARCREKYNEARDPDFDHEGEGKLREERQGGNGRKRPNAAGNDVFAQGSRHQAPALVRELGIDFFGVETRDCG